MTLITTMSVATPSMMPRNENPAMTEMNPCARRARRYRSASVHSTGENARVEELRGGAADVSEATAVIAEPADATGA